METKKKIKTLEKEFPAKTKEFYLKYFGDESFDPASKCLRYTDFLKPDFEWNEETINNFNFIQGSYSYYRKIGIDGKTIQNSS